MKRILCCLTAVLLLTGCAGAETAPEPTGATLTVQLENSWVCTPLFAGETSVFKPNTSLLCSAGDYAFWWEENGMLALDCREETAMRLDGYGAPVGVQYDGNGYTVLFSKYGKPTLVQYDQDFSLRNAQKFDWPGSNWPGGWVQLPSGEQLIVDYDGLLCRMTAEGEVLDSLETTGAFSALALLDGVVYGYEKNGDSCVYRIVPETLEMEQIPIPGLPSYAFDCAAGQDCLYLSTTQYLYKVDPVAASCEILIDYRQSDLPDGYVGAVPMAPDDGSGELLLSQGRFECRDLYRARPRTQEEVDSLQIITLASMGVDPMLAELIRRWNSQNEHYRIVGKNYFTSSGDFNAYEEERRAAEQAFRAELLSGQIPDLICVPPSEYRMLSEKGLLEDLKPWMAQDPAFREEDYFMNLFEGMERNGRLERLPLSFAILTAFAKTEHLNGRTSLTLKEVPALEASLPAGMTLFNAKSGQSSFLGSCVMWQSGNYIDAKERAHFDDPEFVRLLELCRDASTQLEFAHDDYAWQEDRALLYPECIGQVRQFHAIRSICFDGAPVTMTGMPAPKGGDGSLYQPTSIVSVTSCSLYKDVLWDFLRFCLEEETTLAREGCEMADFAVRRDALHEQFLFQPDTYITFYQMDDDQIPIELATEEDEALLTALIESLRTPFCYENELLNIIQEETAMFFAGDCTAQRTAEKIQSRAELYLSEHE